jgi:hypothetical protein
MSTWFFLETLLSEQTFQRVLNNINIFKHIVSLSGVSCVNYITKWIRIGYRTYSLLEIAAMTDYNLNKEHLSTGSPMNLIVNSCFVHCTHGNGITN